MSLMPKKQENDNDGQVPYSSGYTPRRAERMQSTYTKMALQRALKEAAYKESLGMELTPQDQFILDNKTYFEKLVRRKRE